MLLAQGSREDSWICAMFDSLISVIETTTTDDGTWTATVSEPSRMFLWFKSFFPDEFVADDSIHLKGLYSNDSNNSSIQNVDVGLLFPASSGKVLIHLSTAYNPISQKNEDYPDTMGIVNNQGFFLRNAGVVLGLAGDNIDEVSISLTSICALVGIAQPSILDGDAMFKLVSDNSVTNALWYFPSDNNKIALTLSFTCLKDSALPTSKSIDGFTITKTKAVIHNFATVSHLPNADGTVTDYITNQPTLCLQASLVIASQTLAWDAFIGFTDNGITMTLQWNHDDDPLASLWLWLKTKMGLDAEASYTAFDDSRKKLHPSTDTHPLILRQVMLSLDHSSGSWAVSEFSITFKLAVSWGVVTDTSRVPFELIFTYKPSRETVSGKKVPYLAFEADLWLPRTSRAIAIEKYNPHTTLIPPLEPVQADPQYWISLPRLFTTKSGPSNVPDWLPTALTQFNFRLSTVDIALSGTLAVAPDATPSNHWLKFDRIELAATYSLSSSSLTASFKAYMSLTTRYPKLSSAIMYVDVEYSSSAWSVHGEVSNLTGACLYKLFPESENDAIMDLLEDININLLAVTFYHSSGKMNFDAEGCVIIGDLELNLTFSIKDDGWSFEALLAEDLPNTEIYLRDLVADVSASFASELPAFISEMVFDVTKHDSIDLKCRKITVGSTTYIVFSLLATINAVEVSFVQLSKVTIDTTPVKRLFKIGLDALPTVRDVPILTQLEQPFDQMDLAWALADWTKAEIAIINENVYNDKKDQLFVKEPALSAPVTDDTVVLTKGVHFLIIAEENGMPTAVLDHNFLASPVSKTANGTRRSEPGPQVPDKTPETTAPWSKTIGPLTISSISMKFESRKLQLTLDAQIKLGPLEAIFRGLGLAFEPINMQSLSLSSFTVLLSGIGIEMNRPPIILAGEFLSLAPYQYAGGLIVEIEPYAFVAGGFYGDRVTNPSPPPDHFKSMFVFVAMKGPIATIEFASLSGLTGGFGYNSQITLPTVDNVATFPFLNADKDIDSSGDPLKILNNFLGVKPTPWFTPADGPLWIAAGLKVQMFQVLDVEAVVVLDIGEDVIFGVFAKATATIPENEVDAAEQFAFIEMGIVAVYDHGKGMSCETLESEWCADQC